MIQVKDLGKLYGSFPALDSVSFSVGKGQVIGLLGPNGAGKTTTMKIMTCFLPQTTGSVRIAGFDTREQAMEVRQKIGYLPETNPLYPEMTVQEFLHYVADIREIQKSDQKSAIGKMVEACRLERVYYRSIGKLSKGYRQRVGLAQAMIHDPDLLILDEPTSGLDPNQIVDILTLIRNLGEQKTVIHSTHILSEAQETCDQVLVLSRGRLVACDSPAALSSASSGHEHYLRVEGGENHREFLQKISENVQIEELATTKGLRFKICSEKKEDLSTEISNLCAEQNWAIRELSYKAPDLEKVFADLTRTEEEALA